MSKRDQVLTKWDLYKEDNVSEEDVVNAGGRLGWWSKAKRVHPHVAILALKYLALQASSATPERIPSVGGLVVTITRNRLSEDRVADIVFLHESMKHNLWYRERYHGALIYDLLRFTFHVGYL